MHSIAAKGASPGLFSGREEGVEEEGASDCYLTI